MKAMQRFIANSLMDKNVYLTLSAANYYIGMINRSRMVRTDSDPLYSKLDKDMSTTLAVATKLSMRSMHKGQPMLLSERDLAQLHDDIVAGKPELAAIVREVQKPLRDEIPEKGPKKEKSLVDRILGRP
jgi:hypothetical protein